MSALMECQRRNRYYDSPTHKYRWDYNEVINAWVLSSSEYKGWNKIAAFRIKQLKEKA